MKVSSYFSIQKSCRMGCDEDVFIVRFTVPLAFNILQPLS